MANAELSVKTGFLSPEQKAINRFPDVTDLTYFSDWDTSSIDLVLNRERNESGF
jgi:hypothetical protein